MRNINLKPFNKAKYKVKGGMLLLENMTSRIDPVAFVNTVIWVFVGVCLGIIGCFLIINL